MKRTIPLLFSDISFGTEEFGFIPRRPSGSAWAEDGEDTRYRKFLASKGVVARVAGGYVRIG